MPLSESGLVNDLIYHVINRGNSGHQIFNDDKEYEIFIELMMKAKATRNMKILAYCLMPNHFHLLLQPEKTEDLGKWMQQLITSHIQSYNGSHESSGHIWQGKFKSFVVEKDMHLLTAARYVEGNPVRAGLVKSAKDWRWSSHQARFFENTLINDLPIELPEDWTAYVNMTLGHKLEKLHQSLLRQSPYGSEEWVLEICRDHGPGATKRKTDR